MGKWGQYKKKYNKEWEKYTKFKDWLEPPGSDESQAKCRYCKVVIRAHKTDLERHANTKKHKTSTKMLPNRQQPSISTVFPLVDGLSVQTKRAEIKMACHVAVHSSLLTADHLSEVLCSIFKDSAISKTFTLKRTKCTALINNVIGPAFHKQLLLDIGTSPVSLIIDETTDISVTKQMSIVVRYFSVKEENIVTQFLGLVEVNDCTAVGLFNTLTDVLTKCNLPLSQVIGIGTDGASTMCGRNHSVYSLFKQQVPNVILVKCICHSLHLACSKSIDVLPRNIEFLVREAHNWFSHSSKRKDTYRQLYRDLNDGGSPLAIPGVANTRWISHAPAMTAVLNQWDELEQLFRQAKVTDICYTAEILHGMFCDPVNKLYLQFIQPLVKQFKNMNDKFESELVDPLKLHDELFRFLQCLITKVVNPSFSNGNCQHIHTNSTWEEHLLHPSACQLGITFLQNLEIADLPNHQKTAIKERARMFITSAIKETLKRIPENIDLFQKMKYLKPEILYLECFGSFYEAFRPYIALEDVNLYEEQYNLLKLIPVPDEVKRNSISYWAYAYKYTDCAGNHPLQKLANLALQFLSLPISNADVERTFSAVTLTKSCLRNKLSIRTLENILKIKLNLQKNGCCSKFDPDNEMLRLYKGNMYD